MTGCGKTEESTPLEREEETTSLQEDQVEIEPAIYQYTYQNMTISIPISWQENIIFEEYEDGFQIYQKASFDKVKYSGSLI